MTLLEIILSLAFLAGALAVIANISRLGTMSAVSARDTTQAQFLCESIMAQLTSGIIEFESVFDEPVLDFVDTGASNPNDVNDYKWTYSIEIYALDDYGLLEVVVTVTQYFPNSPREPVSCKLVRWMLDKAMAADMLASVEESTDSESSGASSSSQTGGTGGGGNTGGGGTGGGGTGGGGTGGGGTGGGGTGGGGTGGGGTGRGGTGGGGMGGGGTGGGGMGGGTGGGGAGGGGTGRGGTGGGTGGGGGTGRGGTGGGGTGTGGAGGGGTGGGGMGLGG